MYDVYRSCSLPMTWCAKTSNAEIAKSECVNEKLPKGRNGQTEDV
jgi:hypothetical protein